MSRGDTTGPFSVLVIVLLKVAAMSSQLDLFASCLADEKLRPREVNMARVSLREVADLMAK